MNAIALPLTVADIVAEYEAKDAAVASEIKALDEAFTRLDMAATVQGAYVERIAQRPYLHVDTVRKNLLKSGWRAVYQRLQIDAIASAKDRKLFEQAMANPPPLDKPRGKAIGAYATAVLKDGSRLLEVMSLEEIEKVRGVSRASKAGPWVQWWGEMARKTVMRRLSKRLPMSTDLEEEVFQRDETMAHEPRVIEHEPEPAAPVSRLEALEQHIEDADATDADLEGGRDDHEFGDQHDGDNA